MIESLGALGGYGITSVIVIIVAFFLFARFVKKIIGNIIMGGLLFFWLLNTIGITHMTLTTMHGIVVALFGVPGTIVLALLNLVG
ncbi:ABC transporter permease [Dialister succinatiphilus]|uniref:ABC transporter permease n=1 Tax=Dialister succinatiphilus TaxID=487173 RepID=UPI003F7DDECD